MCNIIYSSKKMEKNNNKDEKERSLYCAKCIISPSCPQLHSSVVLEYKLFLVFYTPFIKRESFYPFIKRAFCYGSFIAVIILNKGSCDFQHGKCFSIFCGV